MCFADYFCCGWNLEKLYQDLTYFTRYYFLRLHSLVALAQSSAETENQIVLVWKVFFGWIFRSILLAISNFFASFFAVS